MATMIEFTPEQGMLLDIASRTLRQRWTIDDVRAGLEQGPGFDAALWREMSDLGWHGLTAPDRFEGAEQSVGSLVPLVEPMGRHLVSGPFVDSQCAAQALIASGETSLIDCWLPRIAAGESVALALFEGDGSWQVERPHASLRDGRLDGIKTLVHWAQGAAGLVVSALDESGEFCLIWLEADAVAHCALDAENLIDLTQRSSRMVFDGLAVSADAVLRGEDAERALRALRNTAWLLHAALGVGGAQGALDVLLEYLKSRRQFGRTIGSYQALKHPTVDALIGIERSRSHLYHAATLASQVDLGSDDTTLEAALRTACSTASEALLFVADRAVQFHGGVGFTWECDAQLYLRRAMWLQSRWGDPVHHRTRLAELLLPAV